MNAPSNRCPGTLNRRSFVRVLSGGGKPVTPNDFQATLYRYLGVPLDTEFTDQAGWPVPLQPSGKPIRELVC